MSYATKTCNICGWKDAQPQMYRARKSVKAYTSKDQIGLGTWVGWAFENKASKRRINKALFANNKRKHTAHREVWMCADCAQDHGVSVSKSHLRRAENIDEVNATPVPAPRPGAWDTFKSVFKTVFFILLIISLAQKWLEYEQTPPSAQSVQSRTWEQQQSCYRDKTGRYWAEISDAELKRTDCL